MKTAVEMLEEILEYVQLINKRLDVMEHNTKELMARSNLTFKKPEISMNGKAPIIKPIEDESLPKVKLVGKITEGGKSLFGVSIKILNNNIVVKETRTNKAGEWSSLVTGNIKYDLEYSHGDRVAFASITVPEDQKIMRLSSPIFED